MFPPNSFIHATQPTGFSPLLSYPKSSKVRNWLSRQMLCQHQSSGDRAWQNLPGRGRRVIGLVTVVLGAPTPSRKVLDTKLFMLFSRYAATCLGLSPASVRGTDQDRSPYPTIHRSVPRTRGGSYQLMGKRACGVS